MTTDDKFGARLRECLEAMMPADINDVFRKNRDRGELRYATEDDLRRLRTNRIPIKAIKGAIRSWTYIAFEARISDRNDIVVFLTGDNAAERSSWITSAVTDIHENGSERFVATASGSLYKLEGPSDNELDLPFLCAWLHHRGVGKFFGVPEFFF